MQKSLNMRFMLQDHIGSVSTIVDVDGIVLERFSFVLERFSFDAWDKRAILIASQVWDMDITSVLQPEVSPAMKCLIP